MIRHRLEERLFGTLWRIVSARPGSIVLIALALTGLSVWLASTRLGLNSDQDRLVSPDLPFQQRYLDVLENFGDQEFLYVVIRSAGGAASKKRAMAFADRLADELRAQPDLVRSVQYRVDPSALGDAVLLYAEPADVERIRSLAADIGPRVRRWLARPTFAGVFDLFAELLETPPADPSLGREYFSPAVDTIDDFLDATAAALRGEPAGPLPGVTLPVSDERYAFTRSGRLLVMRIMPQKDYSTLDVIEKPLLFVRDALSTTRRAVPGVEAGLTGRPVLQADEMQTTDRDMTRASVLAVLVVGLLFILAFEGWLRPVLVILSLLLAMAWTFGFATLSVGRLNLLSIVFALVLIGIGVDFGVHVAMRFAEGRRRGRPVEDSVRTSLLRTGPGILLGALTSVCAFYAVVGSDFVGLAELGLIGGTGILLCLLAMLTVLPALLLLSRHRGGHRDRPGGPVRLVVLERITSRPGRLLMAMALLSLVALPALARLRFNYNLLELQAEGLESVTYERALIDDAGDSSWYAVSTASDATELQQKIARFRALPEVGRIESIQDYLPDDRDGIRKRLAEIRRYLPPLSEVPASPAAVPPDADKLRAALQRLADAFEDLEERLFIAGATKEIARVDGLVTKLDGLTSRIVDRPGDAARLEPLRVGLVRTIADAYRQARRLLDPPAVSPESAPELVRDLFIGSDGSLQIKVMPSRNVWDFDELSTFVAALRRTDPESTGVPVGVYESSLLMHRTFLKAAGLTLLLVTLILLLHDRSIVSVGLTLLPLGTGLLWLLELMGLFGIDFNLANFFAIPILIAIGVDGGVHLLARWRESDGRTAIFLTTTPTAVALSFLTTMIGFSGLLMAHHRGLASLGRVMVLGSATGLVATLLVLPAVLHLRAAWKNGKKR